MSAHRAQRRHLAPVAVAVAVAIRVARTIKNNLRDRKNGGFRQATAELTSSAIALVCV
jgi:hypothetical protein